MRGADWQSGLSLRPVPNVMALDFWLIHIEKAFVIKIQGMKYEDKWLKVLILIVGGANRIRKLLYVEKTNE